MKVVKGPQNKTVFLGEVPTSILANPIDSPEDCSVEIEPFEIFDNDTFCATMFAVRLDTCQSCILMDYEEDSGQGLELDEDELEHVLLIGDDFWSQNWIGELPSNYRFGWYMALRMDREIDTRLCREFHFQFNDTLGLDDPSIEYPRGACALWVLSNCPGIWHPCLEEG